MFNYRPHCFSIIFNWNVRTWKSISNVQITLIAVYFVVCALRESLFCQHGLPSRCSRQSERAAWHGSALTQETPSWRVIGGSGAGRGGRRFEGPEC